MEKKQGNENQNSKQRVNRKETKGEGERREGKKKKMNEKK